MPGAPAGYNPSGAGGWRPRQRRHADRALVGNEEARCTSQSLLPQQELAPSAAASTPAPTLCGVSVGADRLPACTPTERASHRAKWASIHQGDGHRRESHPQGRHHTFLRGPALAPAARPQHAGAGTRKPGAGLPSLADRNQAASHRAPVGPFRTARGSTCHTSPRTTRRTSLKPTPTARNSTTGKEKGYRVTLLAFDHAASRRSSSTGVQRLLSPEKTLIYKRYYNIGVAVDTPDGWVVPVVRTPTAGIVEISQSSARSQKARDGSLSPTDIRWHPSPSPRSAASGHAFRRSSTRQSGDPRRRAIEMAPVGTKRIQAAADTAGVRVVRSSRDRRRPRRPSPATCATS